MLRPALRRPLAPPQAIARPRCGSESAKSLDGGRGAMRSVRAQIAGAFVVDSLEALSGSCTIFVTGRGSRRAAARARCLSARRCVRDAPRELPAPVLSCSPARAPPCARQHAADAHRLTWSQAHPVARPPGGRPGGWRRTRRSRWRWSSRTAPSCWGRCGAGARGSPHGPPPCGALRAGAPDKHSAPVWPATARVKVRATLPEAARAADAARAAAQVMTFSVAMNSARGHALVALLIASNFVEIKGAPAARAARPPPRAAGRRRCRRPRRRARGAGQAGNARRARAQARSSSALMRASCSR